MSWSDIVFALIFSLIFKTLRFSSPRLSFLMDPSAPSTNVVSFRQMAYSWDPEFGKPHPEQDKSLDYPIMNLDPRPIEEWMTKDILSAFFHAVDGDVLDCSHAGTVVKNFVKGVSFQQLLDEEKPINSRSRVLINDRTRMEETSTSSRSTKAPLTAQGLLAALKDV